MQKLLSFSGLIVVLAACNQSPAHVEDKGKNLYKQHAVQVAETVTEPAQPRVSVAGNASIQSIETKELAAPAPRTVSTSSLYKMPIEGKIISRFGEATTTGKNDGINIAASAGTPVRAASSGQVVFVGNQLKSYGNMVIIKHQNRKSTTYAHLAKTFVSKGAHVAQGDSIGTVGTTGSVATPQLHFALREGATPEDPMHYMPTMTSSLQ